MQLHNALEPRLPELFEAFAYAREHEQTARHVLAFDDGELVGLGTAAEPGDRRGADAGTSWIGVLPEWRRRGVGSALYVDLSAHLRALGKSACDGWVWSDDADALAFLGARGFSEVERFAFERLDLERYEPADVAPPDGIELVTRAARGELERGMYAVAREALADVPGADRLDPSFEDFRAWEIAHPTRRADLTFVALAGGEVVGYATLAVVPDTFDAMNVMTAVRRDWRRRGVAASLKAAQLVAAKRAGFRAVVTFSELRNEPMRRLNERLGYRPQAPQLRMRGPLAV